MWAFIHLRNERLIHKLKYLLLLVFNSLMWRFQITFNDYLTSELISHFCVAENEKSQPLSKRRPTRQQGAVNKPESHGTLSKWKCSTRQQRVVY